MKCPKCGVDNSSVINETTTTGKDFSAGKGCCGAIMLGPIGVLCGVCGEGRKVHNTNYFVCNSCGHKWKA